jgi:hypothetical protein
VVDQGVLLERLEMLLLLVVVLAELIVKRLLLAHLVRDIHIQSDQAVAVALPVTI